ncbi:hypothetical protein Btru_017545 [Bulinus truncatus]|nr:hypothetical protein Btru_017545 [Bulinus truncatus]
MIDEYDLYYGIKVPQYGAGQPVLACASIVTHEAEVSYKGEADLQEHFICCAKNPDHTTFVPVDEFDIHRLPERYRDQDLVDLINATCDVTVRVAVNHTSDARPEFYPDTKVKYPFFDYIGKKMMRTGTGRVWDVRQLTEEDGVPCPCRACRESDTPTTKWGQINVITATHVVFDVGEARSSTCRLGFNSKDSAYIEVEGIGRDGSDIFDDRYLLTCVTHDAALLESLRLSVDRYNDLCFRVYKKFYHTKDEDKLTIIVSHPHGCSKQISIGEWTRKYEVRRGTTKYSYTACTCPGSSGAPVYTLGRSGWRWMYSHVHSGAGAEVNFSGLGWEN